jgi:hypothetical protein
LIAPSSLLLDVLQQNKLACAIVVVADAAGAAPSYQLSLLLKSLWLMMRAVNTRLRSLSS